MAVISEFKIKDNLPNEYQRVEWVKGTFRVPCKEFNQADDGVTITLSASISSSTSDIISHSGGRIYRTASNESFRFFWAGNNTTGAASLVTKCLDKKTIYTMTNQYRPAQQRYSQGYLTIVKDGNTVTTMSVGFAADWTVTALNLYNTAKIYHLTVDDDNEYIPCYRKSDNAIGLYDIVTDTFTTATGTTIQKGDNVYGLDVTRYNNQRITNFHLPEAKFGLSAGDYHFARRKETENPQLPTTFQQVEYIQSSGTQYIDLGFVPTNATGVKISYVPLNKQDSIIVGVKNAADSGRFTVNSASKVYLSWNALYSTGIDTVENKKYEVLFNYKNDRKRIVDDIEYTAINQTLVVNTNYNLCMFAAYWSSSTASLFANAQIYDCEITERTEITHHFIPCVRKSDNVAGIYNLANSRKNLFDKSDTYTNGWYSPADQTVGEAIKSIHNSTAYHSSKPIEVKPNTTYTQTGVVMGLDVLFLDKDYLFVSGIEDSESGDVRTFTVPNDSNIKYAIVIFQLDSINRVQLEEGSTATFYEPFPFYVNAGTGTFATGETIYADSVVCEDSVAEPIFDMKIKGNSLQDGTPNPEASVEIESVGDLVMDTQDEHYGKYKISIKIGTNIQNIYLSEPLRRIGDIADILDYKNKKVIRNIYEWKIGNELDIQRTLTQGGSYRFWLQPTNSGKPDTLKPSSAAVVGTIMCNLFNATTANNTYLGGIGIAEEATSFARITIYYEDWNNLTAEEVKTLLINKGGIIYYALNTPTEETIEIPTISTIDGKTNLVIDTNTDPSALEIEYWKQI